MKPVIGVVPLYDEKKESIWMLPDYQNSLIEAGALPLVLPLTDDTELLAQSLKMVDGILFTGGQDLGADICPGNDSPFCGTVCDLRDKMEAYLFHRVIAEDIPALGICRGLQLFCAMSGGTLYQDIPTEKPDAIGHTMTPPYTRAAHNVSVLPNTPLAAITGCGTIGVNSYHHQGIRQLGADFLPMAVAEDGLTEAIYRQDKTFCMAVQWHPEYHLSTDLNNRALFRAFVSACGEKSAT